MKKLLAFLMAAALCGLTACGSQIEQEGQGSSAAPPDASLPSEESVLSGGDTPDSSEESGEAGEMKVLVAYFSRTGNTGRIAEMIHETAGGDLIEIKTANAYPEDYDAALAQATEERNNNARPELAATEENIGDYDVIYLGYPIWWGDTPMAILSFLESFDSTGKVIVPFCTYGSSGFGNSVTSIQSSAPDATILEGFGVAGAEAKDAGEAVREWLGSLNLTEP